MIPFGTKAETLKNLSSVITKAKILPQITFPVVQHKSDPKKILLQIDEQNWMNSPLIIRSSAKREDSAKESFAGYFSSVLNVKGLSAILTGIDEVILSFKGYRDEDQILIQPMLQDILFSGVAFSKNQNTGAPYILINYDDTSGCTNSVTLGQTNKLKAYCHYKKSDLLPPYPLNLIVELVFELERLLSTESLDIEFAFTNSKDLYLLQVRPLIIENNEQDNSIAHSRALKAIQQKIIDSNKIHPYLYGSRTIYGIMPDWNPAEIIGIRPKPLALSLYKTLITDYIWACQRDSYGYHNVLNFPLIINFHGLPYIDIRVCFNSFLPKGVEKNICEKLINHYLDSLIKTPCLHDKIEFQIVYSCYTFDLNLRLDHLKNKGFTEEELSSFKKHLLDLTIQVIDDKNKLLQSEYDKLQLLEEKLRVISSSSLDTVSKIYWILEDCKTYGTLPFSGVARMGFIALEMLISLVNMNIISKDDYHNFLESLQTVSTEMQSDLITFSLKDFLIKYGHLRPGTYDILSWRYDENPKDYFKRNKNASIPLKQKPFFKLSEDQKNQINHLLNEACIPHDVTSFFSFIKQAIEGREYSKFIFSKSLSYALSLFKNLCQEQELSDEESAFADISCIKELYESSKEIGPLLRKTIEDGKQAYSVTEKIILPPLIYSKDQVFSFSFPEMEPNFITHKKVTAPLSKITDSPEGLKGTILFIPSADPGYDWIFSHDIKGFVTLYGGMNSHMAIRSAELGIPAIIGCGDILYNHWKKAHLLEIDCGNKLVRIIQ